MLKDTKEDEDSEVVCSIIYICLIYVLIKFLQQKQTVLKNLIANSEPPTCWRCTGSRLIPKQDIYCKDVEVLVDFYKALVKFFWFWILDHSTSACSMSLGYFKILDVPIVKYTVYAALPSPFSQSLSPHLDPPFTHPTFPSLPFTLSAAAPLSLT